jgi:hypothetical protein
LRTIEFPAAMQSKMDVAARRYGMSGSSLIRSSVMASLATLAERDPGLARIFADIDRQGEAARPPSAQDLVMA